MRSGFSYLVLLAVVILGGIFLLPLVGFLLIFGVGLLLLVGLLIWAAPWLAKLPWFRDRIHVNRSGGARFVRFGGGFRPSEPEPSPHTSTDDVIDVIDVEGRELPDRKD